MTRKKIKGGGRSDEIEGLDTEVTDGDGEEGIGVRVEAEVEAGEAAVVCGDFGFNCFLSASDSREGVGTVRVGGDGNGDAGLVGVATAADAGGVAARTGVVAAFDVTA